MEAYGFYLIAIGVLFSIWITVKLIRREITGMRPKNYPPGPPALPIIGNLHLMSPNDIHKQLEVFARKYGSIYSLKFGSQTLVVLNSPEAVKELLDKRSHNYSARQDFFIREFGDNLNILMRSNDDTWRRQRKMYHLRLNVNVADRFLPYQDFETRQLLLDILETPDNYRYHVVRVTCSLGSTIAYGWRTSSLDLPQVKKLFEWIERFSVAAAKSQIMDWYPSLRPLFRRLPSRFIDIQDEFIRIRDIEESLWISQLENVKASIKNGKIHQSFCRDLLINNVEGKEQLDERVIAHNVGHSWAGATDTTGNSLQGFIKAMLLFPEVQREAQKEIDAVVGPDQLPDWTHYNSLPYLRCCMKELLRWFPTTVMGGMPHATTKDDFYNGYLIPAGAGVMNNVYTINNDPTRIVNPRVFDPTRHVGDNTTSQESAVQADPTKRDHFTFGAGRRICPGLHVADRSLFMSMARLLWAFEFNPHYDASGNPELVDSEATTQGFIVAPMPFKCDIRPRGGESRAKKIRDSWAEVSHLIDKNGAYEEEFYSRFSETK